MTEQLNIISICCNVCLNGIDHANTTDSEKIILKNHVNHLFNIAFKYIGQTNRIILITDNGAEIAYSGPPKDAVLIATDILNSILMANKQGSISLSVRIGIHLQPVRLENDFNKQSNIIGAGINVAKQVMQKAKPNEALVSRSYHENVPTTTQASSTLLDDLEVKFENHVLDYQAYLSDLNEKQVTKQVINSEPVTLNQPATSTPIQPSLKKPKYPNASSWRYVLACLFVPLALFSIVKLTVEPAKAPPLKASQPVIIKTQPAIPEIQLEKTDDNDYETDSNLMQEELIPVIPLENATDKKTQVNKSTVEKEVKQKPKSKVDSTPQNSKIKELLSWESLKNSIKQGQKNECTQSEIALNQCRE